MIPHIRCWPILRSAARHVVKHRHIRRAAGIAASKPAIVGYVCVTVGAGAWSLPALMGGIGSREAPTTAETSPAASRQFSYYPPEFFGETAPAIDTAALIPPIAFAPVPDIPTLPQPQPEQPPEQPVPTPEPGSIELLATAVAALAIIRGRA